MRTFTRLALTAAGTLALALVAGCGQGHGPLFEPEKAGIKDDQQPKDVRREIAQLAKGKGTSDEDSADYSIAVSRLTSRGSSIEPQLIEALKGSDDWAVRMGAVEVLASVGTRACVEPLVGATDDPQPLVALYANKLLEGLCSHRVIPVQGEAAGALPPVPRPDPHDLARDAEERQWTAWHHQHHAELRAAWRTWWAANQAKVAIQ